MPVHPYLYYLAQEREQLPPSDHESQTMAADYGFETEMQTFFNKLINRDSAKVRSPMRTTVQLATAQVCQTCGVYEYASELLECHNCGDLHHFFCQIQNASSVPLRVITSYKKHLNSTSNTHPP